MRGFHLVVLKYGHENAEMERENLMTSQFDTLWLQQQQNKEQGWVFVHVLCGSQKWSKFTIFILETGA